MGMAVFTGMLDRDHPRASSLVPVLFVTVEYDDRGGQAPESMPRRGTATPEATEGRALTGKA
jgi:hypothetical protein